MRVLHLTPELPFWPGGSGGSARQFHLLRELARRGHRVEVVACATVEQAVHAAALRDAGVGCALVRRPASRRREAITALLRDPALGAAAWWRPVVAWQTSVFWSRLRPVALRRLEAFRPDVVSVEHDWSAAWARDLPGDVPATLTLHNLSWLYYRNRASAARPLGRMALAVEARRFLRFDRAQAGRYSALLAVSQPDADRAAAALGRPAYVIPNGVSLEDIGTPGAGSDDVTLLFTGSMRYPPNSEGARWFVDRVWPEVRRARPEVGLAVVGPDPADWLKALDGQDRISVPGRVDELRPWFDAATVVIAPILSGGGTRLKVLEALASGRPLVSTTLGAEGVEAVDGEDLLIADAPEAFAESVVALLADPDRRRRLAASGRRLIEESYDYRSIAGRLEALLAAVAR